jgi:hypothetical protein
LGAEPLKVVAHTLLSATASWETVLGLMESLLKVSNTASQEAMKFVNGRKLRKKKEKEEEKKRRRKKKGVADTRNKRRKKNFGLGGGANGESSPF